MIHIKNEAKNWMLNHDYDPSDPDFEKSLNSLIELIYNCLIHQGNVIIDAPMYDSNFGDDRLCLCGHPYYRHFDTYDDMAAIGCKYCRSDYDRHYDGNCPGFKLAPEHNENCQCKSCVGM